jgi:hypothetical protein
MKISLLDRSLYLKGLMLLIRKDRQIDVAETALVMRIGKILGFEKKFCENVIAELLDNKYIVDEPPHFSAPDIAGSFIRDGIRLASVDGQIHEKEFLWLKAVAEVNGLEEKFCDESIIAAAIKKRSDEEDTLEARHFEWE